MKLFFYWLEQEFMKLFFYGLRLPVSSSAPLNSLHSIVTGYIDMIKHVAAIRTCTLSPGWLQIGATTQNERSKGD